MGRGRRVQQDQLGLRQLHTSMEAIGSSGCLPIGSSFCHASAQAAMANRPLLCCRYRSPFVLALAFFHFGSCTVSCASLPPLLYDLLHMLLHEATPSLLAMISFQLPISYLHHTFNSSTVSDSLDLFICMAAGRLRLQSTTTCGMMWPCGHAPLSASLSLSPRTAKSCPRLIRATAPPSAYFYDKQSLSCFNASA